jgi:hypothetical protein
MPQEMMMLLAVEGSLTYQEELGILYDKRAIRNSAPANRKRRKEEQLSCHQDSVARV